MPPVDSFCPPSPPHDHGDPLRIGCLIHSLNGGGAERVMAGLVNRLAERGHEVTLVTLDTNQQDRHFVADTVRRQALEVLSTADHPISTWYRLGRLRKTIIDGNYQVVLSFCDATNLLVLAATRFHRNAPPIVVSERSDPAHQSLGNVKERLRDHLYRQAAAVICLSEDVAATLRHRTGTSPLVIPSAVEPIDQSLRSQLGNNDRNNDRAAQPLRITAAGRLEPEKGFDRLLRAIAGIHRSNHLAANHLPHWRLELLGDGSQMGALRELSEQLGIADHVHFHGWVSPIHPHLIGSDLFVLPSHYEGFPSAMLEAMACGVAVVAVDAGGGVRDAIQHGINAWLVKNDEDALASGIQRILVDAPLRRSLAAQANDVCDRFSWARMVDAYEKVLVACSRTNELDGLLMEAYPTSRTRQ